jgi:ArsR family transcriptional regulator
MKETARLLKLFSDENRLRIVMLLAKKELCVCQLMGVLGVSQPLISRNLSLLSGAGLLKERKDGKLSFYSLRKDMPKLADRVLKALRDELKDDPVVLEDQVSLGECYEFMKETGKCDMKTFLEYMKKKKKKRKVIKED